MRTKEIQAKQSASLIEEFRSEVTNLVTMYSAEATAGMSESNTLRTLEELHAGNGLYLTPEDIPEEMRERLTRDSLDAHLQRVQSEQIAAAAQQAVYGREDELKKKYIGRKHVFLLEDASFQPFESVWLVQNSNELSASVIKARRVSGIIEDLSFEKNLVVLRPTYFSRLFTPRRKYFLVHVINTSTLTAAVSMI